MLCVLKCKLVYVLMDNIRSLLVTEVNAYHILLVMRAEYLCKTSFSNKHYFLRFNVNSNCYCNRKETIILCYDCV